MKPNKDHTMKIDINKKYNYFGSKEKVEQLIRKSDRCETEYPWLTINSHGTALHHREDGTCPDSVYSLIEAKPEPREWDMWVSPNGKLISRSNHGGWEPIRVREILPGEPKGLFESLGLPADSFAKFLEARDKAERVWRETVKIAILNQRSMTPDEEKSLNEVVESMFVDQPKSNIPPREGEPNTAVVEDTGFPPVGATVEFLIDNFHKADEAQGSRVRVVQVDTGTTEDGFWTTKSGRDGLWFFGPNWQDGLELVTEPETPEAEVKTEWRKLGGEEIISVGDEVSYGPAWIPAGGNIGSRVIDLQRLNSDTGFHARRRVSSETPKQTAEAKAKDALEEGWLGPIMGPVKGHNRAFNPDIMRWEDGWLEEACGNSPSDLYAIRAGTELAAKNGLGEKPIQRWYHTPGVMCQSPEGAWVRYSDHLAAIEALTSQQKQ